MAANAGSFEPVALKLFSPRLEASPESCPFELIVSRALVDVSITVVAMASSLGNVVDIAGAWLLESIRLTGAAAVVAGISVVVIDD